MRKLFRGSVTSLALVLLGAQFIRPPRTNPATDPSRTLAAVRPMPAAVANALDRGCRDCHSNETRWPWYSHVAPLSWFVIDHVNHGRSHFNYSDWSRYTTSEAVRLLKKSCQLVKEQSMPLRSYTLMHPDARLTAEEVAALCVWGVSEVARESPPSPRLRRGLAEALRAEAEACRGVREAKPLGQD